MMIKDEMQIETAIQLPSIKSNCPIKKVKVYRGSIHTCVRRCPYVLQQILKPLWPIKFSPNPNKYICAKSEFEILITDAKQKDAAPHT